MHVGISTYSLVTGLKENRLSVVDAIDWIADQGVEHVEIVPIGFQLLKNAELVDKVVDCVTKRNIYVSNYAVHADFAVQDHSKIETEIQRLQAEVEIAKRLGSNQIRFDAAWLPPEQSSIMEFEKRLPIMAEAIRKVVVFAEQCGVLATVENHGFFVQHSDRVLRLLSAVNHPNYRVTLDVGNFLCVDEDPMSAVQKLLPHASMIHIKDFYRRKNNPGEGFFQTAGGNYLRGAIVGHGDIDLKPILHRIKSAGFDGNLSVEFEGMENSFVGSRVGLQNLKSLWSDEQGDAN